jgi:hypothetical protein
MRRMGLHGRETSLRGHHVRGDGLEAISHVGVWQRAGERAGRCEDVELGCSAEAGAEAFVGHQRSS